MSLFRTAVAVFAAASLAVALAVQATELKPWVGGAAPALDLKDLEGAAHRLEAYRGRVVIVNFWATWCEPCRDEMPSLNKLRRSFAGDQVAVLGVNMGDGEARIGEFLKKVPVEFPVLLDRDSQVAKAWKVRLLPITFIIGPDGRIRYSHAGERDWADEGMRAKIAALAREARAR